MKKLIVLISLFGFILFLAGCGSSGGGGGGGGTAGVRGVTAPEQVSVADTGSSSGSTSQSSLYAWTSAASVDNLSDSSDYKQDKTEYVTWDPTTRLLGQPNNILCVLSKFAADTMVSETGVTYVAQYNAAKCEQDRDELDMEKGNQTSGTGAPETQRAVVYSKRVNDDTAQVVRAWIPMEEDYGTMVVRVKGKLYESPSDTNPYGRFHLDFVERSAVDTPLRGVLEANQVGDIIQLGFWEEESFNPPGSFRGMMVQRPVAVEASSFENSGTATAKFSEPDAMAPGGTIEDTINIRYNPDKLHGKELAENEDFCLDRKDYHESVWSYGLYNKESGERKTRQGGIPLVFDSGPQTYYGWYGYYGFWFSEDVSIDSGTLVRRETYSDAEESDTYRVFEGAGKLIRKSRDTVPLDKIEDVLMDYWEGDTRYRIAWNPESSAFKTADRGGTLALTGLWSPGLYIWADALGGDIQIKFSDCVEDTTTGKYSCDAYGTDTVITYNREKIQPGDTSVPETLYCKSLECPLPAPRINTTSWDTSPFDLNLPVEEDSVPANATYDTYTFDANRYDLAFGGVSSVEREVDADTTDWGRYGIQSGPLFAAADSAALACDWDTSYTCGWQAAENIDEYYVWETGDENWSKLTALRDPVTGEIVDVQPPISVKYEPGNSTYRLSYHGFGELEGIPGKCVDAETGEDTACEEGGEELRWVPAFSIPSGDTVASLTNPGTEYFVKQLQVEQRLKNDPTGCGSLTPLQTLPVLGEDDWTSPNIGPKPSADSAPAVINGEVQ